MQAQLAKSLYLGLAALSLGAVATVTTTATTADAASKAKVVSKSSLGKDSKNVELTGTNAIYSKPGTVKGAKTVASKKTVKKLASSTHSKDYFRAYYMAVTNRGTVYYKIVSMNGKYRGYIYGGKIKGTIGAGIKEAQTTKEATMPTRTAGFHIKNVKKNTLWTAPQHTTYKAHKVNMYGTTKDNTFTVTKAETKTKEGSLYYYVTSDNNSAVSGWIFAGEGYKDASSTDFGGLSINKTEAEATNNNSVKIVYREAGKQVGEATWINSAGNTTAGSAVADAANAASVKLDVFAANSMPTGFKAKEEGTITNAVKNATYGNTVYVDVVTAASSKVQLVVNEVKSDDSASGVTVTGPLAPGNKLSSSDLAATLSTSGISMLSGEKGTQIGDTQLTSISKQFGGTEIKGTKVYHDAKGGSYYYKFTFVAGKFASDNRLANYGDQLTATYTATLTKGTPTVSSSNSVWIA